MVVLMATPRLELDVVYTSVHDALAVGVDVPLSWHVFWIFSRAMQSTSVIAGVLQAPESQFPAWEDPIGALQGY